MAGLRVRVTKLAGTRWSPLLLCRGVTDDGKQVEFTAEGEPGPLLDSILSQSGGDVPADQIVWVELAEWQVLRTIEEGTDGDRSD